MSRPTKSNVPPEPLRWSVKRAAVEFATSVMTLRKMLVKVGVAPGSDGCFSTAEICKAVFGGLAEEKLLTQRQLTRKYQLENQITESRVLDKAALMAGLSQISDAIVSHIMARTELPRETREDILRDLSSIPLVLEDVASRQSKLPRRNGQKDTGDEDDG
jgi:hypothetical protein